MTMANKFFGLIGTSFGLVALYLVLTNAFGAEKVLRAAGDTYVGAIKALQGR
jgi:hypothetical protein